MLNGVGGVVIAAGFGGGSGVFGGVGRKYSSYFCDFPGRFSGSGLGSCDFPPRSSGCAKICAWREGREEGRGVGGEQGGGFAIAHVGPLNRGLSRACAHRLAWHRAVSAFEDGGCGMGIFCFLFLGAGWCAHGNRMGFSLGGLSRS